MSRLSEKQLTILNGELQRGRKSTLTAYLLWLFLGTLGIHKFYLGKTAWGIVYLLLTVFGWSTGGAGLLLVLTGEMEAERMATVGLVLLALLGLFLLIDLFTIPRQIRKHEQQLKEKMLADFERQNYTA
ncbi:MAG: TM2 domain-containing protein [Firmicutes bacterium]|nr:TM2 domain-containing protein [Bacillota bacterium]